MEKIYMEDNKKKKQSKFMQILNSKLSDTLSISMIIVAFASFLVMGFSGNVSYALPLVSEIPEELTVDQTQVKSYYSCLSGCSQTSAPVFVQNSDGSSVIINKMILQNGSFSQQGFCLNSNNQFPVDSSVKYINPTKLNNPVVTSILRNSYPEVNIAGDPDVGTWVTQVALWTALRGSSDNTAFTLLHDRFHQVTHVAINNTTSYDFLAGNGDGINSLSVQYMNGLLSKAYSYTQKVNKPIVSKANNDISVTDDGKFYQTSLITISSDLVFEDGNDYNNGAGVAPYKDIIQGYYLDLPDNIPEGIQIIGEDGKEIKKDVYTTHMPTTKFYVRVPVSSLTNENKNVSINVVGKYMENQSIVYSPDNGAYQSVVILAYGPAENNFEFGVDFTYTADVPDTGMTSAQSLYFIGLVILLCGVGIIYANTKPRQEQ